MSATIFGTLGNDSLSTLSSQTDGALVFANDGNDTVVLRSLTTLAPTDVNVVYGGNGNDDIFVYNSGTGSRAHLHGEAGRDVLISNSTENGLVNSPLGAFVQGISGGTGSDIMKIFNPSLSATSTSTFLSDTRLFKNPTTGTLAENGYVGTKSFLEGGRDVAHGSDKISDTDILELRGFGWSIQLDNGAVLPAAVLTAPNITDYILTGVKSGLAMAYLTNSSNAAENGLHVMAFDNIEKIRFFDGGIGGSNDNLTYNLSNSTTSVNPLSVLSANHSGMVQGSEAVTIGTNGGGSFNTTPGSINDVVMMGAGNKTVNVFDGENVIIMGNGTQTVTGGIHSDTFVVRSDVNIAAAKTLTMQGGAGEDWLDISGLNQTSLSLVTNLGTFTFTGVSGGTFIPPSPIDGSSTIGATNIAFTSIEKIIF